MDYAHITRTHTGFQAPALLPNAAHYLSTYGHLIAPNETVQLDVFAARIEAHYDNLRCAIEAGDIRRWFDLMRYAEDSMTRFGALPLKFEWEFEVHYAEDIQATLGPAALNYLLADKAA